MNRYFTLKQKPTKNIKNGLMVIFDKETETETKYAFADIIKGQSIYTLPKEKNRKVIEVFMKIKDYGKTN